MATKLQRNTHKLHHPAEQGRQLQVLLGQLVLLGQHLVDLDSDHSAVFLSPRDVVLQGLEGERIREGTYRGWMMTKLTLTTWLPMSLFEFFFTRSVTSLTMSGKKDMNSRARSFDTIAAWLLKGNVVFCRVERVLGRRKIL